MRALIVYSHPSSESFTAAVRDAVTAKLESLGAEYRVCDLYALGFDPCLSPEALASYGETGTNQTDVREDIDDVLWCDTLIFIYPTWWYGMPAILKGWLDRVLLPGVAFKMPDHSHKNIRPGLTHISRMGVFTTCGASRWLTLWIGAPGKRTLMRGIGLLCGPGLKKVFAAHYLMDSSSDASRKVHLDQVGRQIEKLLR